VITQKDIAARLGISASLVSRALSGTAKDIGASKETVALIRKTASELGYTPNVAALTLRGEKSKTIGVVIKDFDDPFLGKMTGELQQLCQRDGYSLILTGFNIEDKVPCDTSSLLRYQLDALIVCGSYICGSWVKNFISRDIPVVQIGADRKYAGVGRVEVDEAKCFEALVGFLGNLGHSHIGFLGTSGVPHQKRCVFFERALHNAGLKADKNFIAVVSPGINAGGKAMAKLFRQAGKSLPTAIVASDDMLALQGIRVAYEEGINIPSDISLTGFDDISASSMMIPSLTTVRVPVKKMIGLAFLMIFNKESFIPEVKYVDAELVKRESCSSCNK